VHDAEGHVPEKLETMNGGILEEGEISNGLPDAFSSSTQLLPKDLRLSE